MSVMTAFVVASFARSVTSAPSPPDVGALAKGPSADVPRRAPRPSAGGAQVRPPRPSLVDGDGGEKVTGAIGSTTEDPLHAYCNVACKDGMGSVVCDCPDHIIGRRSVDVNLAGRSMNAVLSRRFGWDQARRGQREVTRPGEVGKSHEMCEEWCREGLGGSACNCDLLPVAHKRPVVFQ